MAAAQLACRWGAADPCPISSSVPTKSRTFFYSRRCDLSLALQGRRNAPAPPLRMVAAAGGSGGLQDEEARWVREEQRWLREEQRWEREERRWEREREALHLEVALLRDALAQALARQAPTDVGQAIDVEVHLRALGIPPQDLLPRVPVGPTPTTTSTPAAAATLPTPAPGPIALSQQAAPPPLPAAPVPTPAPQPHSSPSPAPSAAPASVSSSAAGSKAAAPEAPARRALKYGADGDDVQEMQNALALEGFYCGEEDMEFQTFGSSTERAVKTWQATVKEKEDGVMTPVLLARLLGEDESSTTPPAPSDAPAVGAEQASTTEAPTRDKPEIERYARSSLEQGEHRVYLLGENRWEDPARLHKRRAEEASSEKTPAPATSFSATRQVNGVINVEVARGNGAGLKVVVKKCFECRGDGRTTCMECEGTGDLNVEEQFLDWAGDDPKCLYCDGTGAQTCGVCDGTGLDDT